MNKTTPPIQDTPVTEKHAILRIERRPLTDLRPHPENPRDHPAPGSPEWRTLEGSIAHDYFDPIILNERNGLLVGGHLRTKVLLHLGYTHADVSIVSYDDATHRARLIAANKPTGTDNEDKLKSLIGSLSASGVDPVLAMLSKMPEVDDVEIPRDAPARIDEAAELNKKWNVEPGDVWQIGEHRLMCGSSTEATDVAALLAGNKPRLMVTDPPYGVEYDPEWRANATIKAGGKVVAACLGKVTNDDRAAWSACYVHSPAIIAYVWHAGTFASVVEKGLNAANFEVRSQIIWSKKRFVLSRGSYHCGHEPCWYAVKKGETANFLGGRKQSTLWADIIDHFEPKAPDPLCAILLDAETVYAFPASASTVWSITNDKACGGGALHPEAPRVHGPSQPQPRGRRVRPLPRLRHHNGRRPESPPEMLRHGDQPRLLRRHHRAHVRRLPRHSDSETLT